MAHWRHRRSPTEICNARQVSEKKEGGDEMIYPSVTVTAHPTQVECRHLWFRLSFCGFQLRRPDGPRGCTFPPRYTIRAPRDSKSAAPPSPSVTLPLHRLSLPLDCLCTAFALPLCCLSLPSHLSLTFCARREHRFDSFLTISCEMNGQSNIVYCSDVASDTVNPDWPEATISYQHLCRWPTAAL